MLKTEFPRRLEYTLQYQLKILKNRLIVALLQYTTTDLDPRLPIPITRISNDITIPPGVNGATFEVSLKGLVVRALGLPRSLVLYHNREKPTLT